MPRHRPPVGLLACAAVAAVAVTGCAAPAPHYLPGVVDDALAGALLNGPLAPEGRYRLGGGPGTDARGCRTTSHGRAGPPGAPGTRFACQEDFDAPRTADHVAMVFDVAANRHGCFTARVKLLSFVVADGGGPRPQLDRFPAEVRGCGLAAVEQD